MSEYESILDETLDSFFDGADSKEDYDQIVEACKAALQRAKEQRKEFIEENEDEEDDDFDDDDDDDDDEFEEDEDED